jgi:hypothetical protein
VLVLDVEGEHAQVALVHPFVEDMTDWDVLVDKTVAGSRFPIVVESDLVSVLWVHQLRILVGHVGEEVLDEANRALAGEPSSLLVGLPLEGRLDGRWEFKEGEGAALRSLCADCVNELTL